MKKLALTLCIGLLGITVSFGQAIKLGVLAGANWSTFVEPQAGQDEKSSAVFGGRAGLFTEFTLGSLSIQPAVFYTAAGF